MMKQKYIKPEINVLEIESESIMAASVFDVPVDNNNTYDGTFHSKKNTFNVWGEDEEDI